MIYLLEDPDEEVYRSVAERLADFGLPIIPRLQDAWASSRNTLVQERIPILAYHIRFEDVRRGFVRWSEEGAEDLLEAALILERFVFPEADIEALREKVAELRRAIWLELHQHLSLLERVHVVHQVLFQRLGYEGSLHMLRKPAGSFLGYLLKNKKGNPQSMALLALIIGQQLELPVYGVCFPQNPLMALTSGYVMDFDKDDLTKDVLCYFYPYMQGAVISNGDIEENLRSADISPEPLYYRPAPNRLLFCEVLKNIALYYEAAEEPERASEMKEFQQIIQG